MPNKNLFSISVLNANNKDYTYNLDYFSQGTKRIFVTVLDVNDNYPQFENSPYDVNVSEVSRREFTIFFSDLIILGMLLPSILSQFFCATV